jgi:hypothetical protein
MSSFVYPCYHPEDPHLYLGLHTAIMDRQNHRLTEDPRVIGSYASYGILSLCIKPFEGLLFLFFNESKGQYMDVRSDACCLLFYILASTQTVRLEPLVKLASAFR